MKEIKNQIFTGERILYGLKDLIITDTVFDNGESPLKECSDITLNRVMFRWKYPIWYSKNITVAHSTWFEMARAGVWYINDIIVKDSLIEAPKNFRKCSSVCLENVSFSNAAETLWHCKDVKLKNVTVNNGDYFAMDSENITVDGLTLFGNYSFDGCRNVEIRNSRLLSRDAFWNCENVTVYDSFISGEYLGWNSKKLTLINCTVQSLQGMCYIDELVMKNCLLIDTTLAFEFSSVNADISSGITSVLNPKKGEIKAEHIGELIIEKERIDPEKVKIICSDIDKRSARPDWIKENTNV